MLQVYSQNVQAAQGSAFPLQNAAFKYGSCAELSGEATIQLNKQGVYRIAVSAASATAATIQLMVNGAASPQTLFAGTNPGFETFVYVPKTCCCCQNQFEPPTQIQIVNAGDAQATLTLLNVVVDKQK